MKPTATLIEEHEVILQMLEVAEREAQAQGLLDAQKVAGLLEFFANFADRLHHAKEEKLLFPRLEERGMPHGGGPIAVMLMEHDEGRACLKRAREALPQAGQGHAPAVATVRRALLDFVELLRGHIHKENMVLFRMADQLLTGADQSELEAAFAQVNAVEMAAVRQQQLEFARRMAGKNKTK
jgi:hemerythrin-like domain-containing protein